MAQSIYDFREVAPLLSKSIQPLHCRDAICVSHSLLFTWPMGLRFFCAFSNAIFLFRGTIVKRTYGTHKNLYIKIFLLTIFGPISYALP